MFPDKKRAVKYLHLDSILIQGRVSDFMSKPPITITKDKTMAEAKAMMHDHRISGIPIVNEDGILIGIVTIENIILALEGNFINENIERHMVKDVVYIKNNMDVASVMEFLMTYSYGRYPVVDMDKKVVGIVTPGDLMLHLYGQLGNIYMHNKRRDEILTPIEYPPSSISEMDDNSFSFDLETTDLDLAGTGSMLFKKFLQERGFPVEAIRRATISLYEAEVNVLLHAGGKGYIKAYLKDNLLFIVIVDYGPGIEDIDLAMQPGYTTATDEVRERGFGAGMGLDNIKRYSDKLIILSSQAGVKIELVIISRDKEETAISDDE
jgi:CBS domain-containing protein/anti-sigma regulatory factor (Ser/Thr protein kinase)